MAIFQRGYHWVTAHVDKSGKTVLDTRPDFIFDSYSEAQSRVFEINRHAAQKRLLLEWHDNDKALVATWNKVNQAVNGENAEILENPTVEALSEDLKEASDYINHFVVELTRSSAQNLRIF